MTRSRQVEHYSAFSPHVKSRVVTALAPVGERPGRVDKACRYCGHHICSCAHVWVDFHSTRVVRFDRDPSFSATRYRAGEPLSIGDLVCLRADGKAYRAKTAPAPQAEVRCAHGISGACTHCRLDRSHGFQRAGSTITGNWVDPCPTGVAGSCKPVPSRAEIDAVPADWYADNRESGLYRHTSCRDVAVAETNADGDMAWRFWGVIVGGTFTAHRATRTEAMCAALGYDTAKITMIHDPYCWRKPNGDFGDGWFASAELAALAALAFDTAQRARGTP